MRLESYAHNRYDLEVDVRGHLQHYIRLRLNPMERWARTSAEPRNKYHAIFFHSVLGSDWFEHEH